jgi:hypothetical protein
MVMVFSPQGQEYECCNGNRISLIWKRGRMTDLRPLRWHDLPFAYRMAGRGTSFDTHLRLIAGADYLRHAQLTGNGRTQIYVLRRPRMGGGLASLYYPAGDHHARLGYLAPSLEAGANEDLWLRLLDGLARVAGQRGTFTIAAEVDECSSALEVLRRADFAIYARQGVWMRPPAPLQGPSLGLREANAAEIPGIQALYGALVPPLIRQVEPMPLAADRFYVLDGPDGLRAMVAAYRGARRAIAELYLHPEFDLEAQAVLNGALALLHAETHTLYFRLRRYMGWLDSPLEALGFNLDSSQAVMVRHMAARIKAQEGFKALPAIDSVLASTPLADVQNITVSALPAPESSRHV